MAQVHPEPSASVTQVDTNTLKTNAEFDADIEYDPVLEGVQIQSPTEDREPFSIYELEQEKPEDYDVSDEDEETDQRPTSGSSQPNSEANDAGNERPTTQEASEEVRVLPMNGIKTDTAESNYLNSTKASECAIKGQTQNGDSKVFPENHFSLIFEQLSYFVKPGGFHMPWTQNRKYIFRNITAEIKSGELTAIMGPSGAGKSTLLDALSRRKVRNVTGWIVLACMSINERQK